MVKIESDLLDDAALRKMGIVIVNTENHNYKYIDPGADKRAGSEYQQEVEGDMTTAAKIWANKPGCWQDHFRRATKFQHYGESWDYQYGFSQTGYQLAIQTLMSSLGKRDGTYYNPQCFCLHPRDLIGQKLSCLSRLRINQTQPINYEYDETHLLASDFSPDSPGLNPFISAALLNERTAGPLSLETDCLRTLFDTGLSFPFYLEEVDDLCQYPPVFFRPISGQHAYDITIDEQRYWIYNMAVFGASSQYNGATTIIHETKTLKYHEELQEHATLPVSFAAEFVGPAVSNSLCGMGILTFFFSSFGGGCMLGFYHTASPPLWDVYFGNENIYTVGTGPGEPDLYVIFLTSAQAKQFDTSTSSFAGYPKAKPLGRQPYHPPEGKITGPYTPTPTCGEKNPNGMGWNGIIYDYHLSDTIDATWNGPKTEFLFTMKVVGNSDNVGDVWYPYGACWIDLFDEDGHGYDFNLNWPNVVFDPSIWRYCINSELTFHDVNHVRFTLRSNPAFRTFTYSQIGIPGGKPECGADVGPSLWILERGKSDE